MGNRWKNGEAGKGGSSVPAGAFTLYRPYGLYIFFEAVAFVMKFVEDTSCFGELIDHKSLPMQHSFYILQAAL